MAVAMLYTKRRNMAARTRIAVRWEEGGGRKGLAVRGLTQWVVVGERRAAEGLPVGVDV